MKKIIAPAVAGIVAAALVLYAVDYAILYYRISRNRSPYDSVTVRFFYQVQEKNQRTEYAFASAQQQTCVNSIFPHQGFESCWYARRHTERPIKI